MDEFRTYIISIITASIISSVAISLTKKMSTIGKLVQLISGLFLLMTILTPVCDFPMLNLIYYYDVVESDAAELVAQGNEFMEAELVRIITEKTETYILSKATELGVALSVEVVVSDTPPNVPVSITISGAASPYIKQQLRQVIANDLGIQEANQVWV